MKFLVHGMKREQVDVKRVLFLYFFGTSCEIKCTDDNRKQFIENTFDSLGSGVAIFSTFLQNELVM